MGAGVYHDASARRLAVLKLANSTRILMLQHMMQRYQLIPLVLWIVGILLVVFLSQRERSVENEHQSLIQRVTAEQVQLRLEACLQSRIVLVSALANESWMSAEDVRARWNMRAEPLIGLFPGVQALNFVDVDSVITVVVPEAPNRAAIGGVLRNNPNPSVVAALASADGGKLARTGPIELLQSGKGFTVYDQIVSSSGDKLGYANGVFRIDDLMRTCLSESRFDEKFQIALYEEGDTEPFYLRPEDASKMPWNDAETLPVGAADRAWQMTVARKPQTFDASNAETETLILFFGVSVVSLAAFLMWLLLANQRSLRESQERYRFLVENQTDFVVQLDAHGNLTYVSPSFCTSQGKASDELVGTPFHEVLESEHMDSLSRIREEIASSPHTASAELETRTVNGYRWIAWSFAGVAGDKGDVEVINATGRDLTDVRLLEDRIAHAEKMKALGEMAGGITHDFNNLLQVMLGNVEFLVRGADGQQKDQLEQVEHAITRAMNLTDKLATLSRQQRVEQQQLDLSAFTEEISSLLRHTMPSTITVQIESPGEPVYVLADAAQIEQVVLNLAFNAKDSIDNHGTIRIGVGIDHLDAAFCRTHPELDPGQYARVSVTDNGSGIPVDALPRIFDPFFTTKSIGDGHGLGLSNCDSIIRHHGGIILADSA